MTDNPTSRISACLPLIKAADGLTLSQVCALSSLEPSTIQNWIKRGFVPHPVNKKYGERHLARILLISKLRICMQIDKVGELLRYINGDTDDESDDIITEEKLYDIFAELSDRLSKELPPPNMVEDEVKKLLSLHPEISVNDTKLKSALTVMGATYMANIYKQKADDLLADLF